MTPELGILADDLTGATDTGLQFAKSGRRTCVCLTWPSAPACDVLVVDTDSRNRSAAEAKQRVTSATTSLLALGVERLYKKVDSTGRGNLGAEIVAVLDAAAARTAVVAPAFPQLGRTVRDGRMYVREHPLDQTEFALDPLWPATTSSIEAILRRQSDGPVAFIELAELRRGPDCTLQRLSDAFRRGARFVVVDSETNPDLRVLAEALRVLPEPHLAVGSAGLAEALVETLERPARTARALSVGSGPILVVAGTMNRVGVGQVARLVERGAGAAVLDLELALAQPDRAAAALGGELARNLDEKETVVLALADPRGAPIDLAPAMDRSHLDPLTATERLMGALALASSRAIEQVPPAALILTGGDTARAVCASLGIHALEIIREAAPGVPICRLQGGPWDGLIVATKAGGFGDVATLATVVDTFRRMRG